MNIKNNNNNDTIKLLNASKENIQKRHYFILENLQRMVKEIEKSCQARFSLELLTSLSSSLLDGTVFEIARGLIEIQHMTEKNLYYERNKIQNEYSTQRELMLKHHRESELACETRAHHRPIVQAANKRELDAFDKRMNDELNRFDLKVQQDFDEKVIEQQEVMSRAGVPGFHVTKELDEVKQQIYIFDFIQRLSEIKMPF